VELSDDVTSDELHNIKIEFYGSNVVVDEMKSKSIEQSMSKWTHVGFQLIQIFHLCMQLLMVMLQRL
jgi:hypothetical protein